MNLCPFAAGLRYEELKLKTDDSPQGWAPLLIISPQQPQSSAAPLRRPAVICIHSTGSSKETMQPAMERYAADGYVTVGMDCRCAGHPLHSFVVISAFSYSQICLINCLLHLLHML